MAEIDNYIVGNDDSIFIGTKNVPKKALNDFTNMEELGLIVSKKYFRSKDGVFFEEYTNKNFKRKEILYEIAMNNLLFLDNPV